MTLGKNWFIPRVDQKVYIHCMVSVYIGYWLHSKFWFRKIKLIESNAKCRYLKKGDKLGRKYRHDVCISTLQSK
jgi:hypothetical protein